MFDDRKFISKLYNRSLEYLILPIGDQVDKGNFMNWLRKYRQEQWLPIQELRRIQTERLAKTLSFTRKSIPFYKEIPKLENPFEDIKNFPIMRKTDINQNIDNLTLIPKENLISESGSGSSGIQGTIYMDKSAQSSQRAMQALWFEWSGYQMGNSILQTGMTLKRGFIKKLKDYFLDTDYTQAFNLDPQTIKEILTIAQRKKPSYLFGYASSLYVLAQTAIDLKIKDIRFRHSVSWGDKLFPHYREKIREAFGCETIDTYGCTEGAMIAAECLYGRLHLSINQCYIEIVDDEGNPVPPGNFGKVLATRLDNFSMPLVRYYLGDLAEMEPDEIKCGCGRELPLLRRIIGRDTDIVKTKSGKQLIVHFFTGIFEHITEIQQFKVVQQSLDEIEIQYIPTDKFSNDVLTGIENIIFEHLQEKLLIKWIKADSIAPTGSGKPQIIQSFLKQSLSH